MKSILISGVFFFSANISATTIDFEGIPLPGVSVSTSSFNWDGMTFTSSMRAGLEGISIYRDGWGYGTGYPTIGEISLMANKNYCCTYAPYTKMKQTDEALFSLNSFVTGANDKVRLIGDLGDSVIYAFTTELLSVSLSASHTLYYLPSEWTDLNSVEWTTGERGEQFMLDNITVNSAFVPIPAAVWLFGSALAGLGWMRRRRAA